MRLYVKKLCQALLAVSVLSIFYLLTISDTDLDRDGLPWGEDFRCLHQEPRRVADSKYHHGFRSQHWLTNSSSLGRPQQLQPRGLYPSAENYEDDRIIQQLEVRLKQDSGDHGEIKRPAVKKILVYNGIGSWHTPRGSEVFSQCAVPACQLTDDRSTLSEADVVIFQQPPRGVPRNRRPGQIWVLFLLESPYHSPSFAATSALFNWTATYRRDSTLVAPYEKYVALDAAQQTPPPPRNYAQGKTKKVAWFVSNCGARNRRRQYAEQLARYIQVDIYGACGKLKCPRFHGDRCFTMLDNEYKFYLAFENSNCRDYITEKFFVNGLKHAVVPVVMGAAPQDYARAAPPHSFIHVDQFRSPRDLAAFLLRLDGNDTLYNQYLAWKSHWANINTHFWCRVCALAHDAPHRSPSWYEDVERWWRGPGVCIGHDNWRTRTPQALIGKMPLHV